LAAVDAKRNELASLPAKDFGERGGTFGLGVLDDEDWFHRGASRVT
jgi:hypothetical protein